MNNPSKAWEKTEGGQKLQHKLRLRQCRQRLEHTIAPTRINTAKPGLQGMPRLRRHIITLSAGKGMG